MQLVALLILLVLAVAEFAHASHSHFQVARSSSQQGQHARLARRARSPNGRCGAQSKHKATMNLSHSSHNLTVPVIKSANNVHSYSAGGVINVSSSCGPTGATPNVSPTDGPNGDIDWLNCGLSDGGWRPPYIQVSDIITQSLTATMQEPGSPFTACKAYVAMFEQYAGQFNVPSILIAAIAMQESGCNANTVGGAGEQGLMQLTQDKCGGAPNGNCRDPAYNIKTGAEYFSTTLQNNAGSLLLTLGNYNGWFEGLTVGQATAAASGPCCRCQNNLDYLQQTLNGWCQNVNPYSSNPRIGKYFNLDQCKL